MDSGSYGVAVTIISEGQELLDLQALEQKISTHIPPLPGQNASRNFLFLLQTKALITIFENVCPSHKGISLSRRFRPSPSIKHHAYKANKGQLFQQ